MLLYIIYIIGLKYLEDISEPRGQRSVELLTF